MGVKIDQDSEVGEYDSAMQTLLQLIWGEGFLSPGGADEVAYLLEGSDIRGCKVLDIGAGLGVIDQLLVTRHGARSVLGIDVDPVLLKQMDARIAHAQLADRIKSLCVTPVRCRSNPKASMSYFRRMRSFTSRTRQRCTPIFTAFYGRVDASSRATGCEAERGRTPPR